MEFFGTYGGHIAGFGGFLCGFAAVLYARAQVGEVKAATKDLDWQEVAELSIDVAKLKKAAQKWQNNECTGKSVTKRTLRTSDDTTPDATTATTTPNKDGGDVNVFIPDTKL